MVRRLFNSAFIRINSYFLQPCLRALIKIFLKPVHETYGNESAVSLDIWFLQKVIGYNKKCYWPVHFTSTVKAYQNIYVGIDAAPGISSNSYIDGSGGLYVDHYAQMAPNVEIYTEINGVSAPVRIGRYCRIGMGSKIYPGVVLGDFSTVAAGSVIKDSFPNGYCVISGDPAKMIIDYSQNKSIKEKFIQYTNPYEYHGYIPKAKFENYRKKNLWL